MEEKLKNKLLMDISLYMFVEINEIEYAYNKLRSIDKVIDAINFSRMYNYKLSFIAHRISEPVDKNGKDIIDFIMEGK